MEWTIIQVSAALRKWNDDISKIIQLFRRQESLQQEEIDAVLSIATYHRLVYFQFYA